MKDSLIHGKGLFTTEEIDEGEIVIRWGGYLLTSKDLEAGKAKPHTAVGVAEDVLLAAHPDQPYAADDFLNHSCDPNIWMGDAITLVARRRIEAMKELTADYALWTENENYEMNRPCNCGARDCRGLVTGRDWRRRELQSKYGVHFAPFIVRRIQGAREGGTAFGPGTSNAAAR